MSIGSVKSICSYECNSESKESSTSLHMIEDLIQLEILKLHKYRSIEKTQQQNLNFLNQNFSASNQEFTYSKAAFTSLLKTGPDPQTFQTTCKLLLNSQPALPQGSFLSALNQFHFSHLTDKQIENLLPLWKNPSNYTAFSPILLKFISACIESKMKLDLLNSATEDLEKTHKKLRISLKKLENLQNNFDIVQHLYSSTTETNEGNEHGSVISPNKALFIFDSEDLYGSFNNLPDNSTILLQSSENLCSCFSCQII